MECRRLLPSDTEMRGSLSPSSARGARLGVTSAARAWAVGRTGGQFSTATPEVLVEILPPTPAAPPDDGSGLQDHTAEQPPRHRLLAEHLLDAGEALGVMPQVVSPVALTLRAAAVQTQEPAAVAETGPSLGLPAPVTVPEVWQQQDSRRRLLVEQLGLAPEEQGPHQSEPPWPAPVAWAGPPAATWPETIDTGTQVAVWILDLVAVPPDLTYVQGVGLRVQYPARAVPTQFVCSLGEQYAAGDFGMLFSDVGGALWPPPERYTGTGDTDVASCLLRWLVDCAASAMIIVFLWQHDAVLPCVAQFGHVFQAYRWRTGLQPVLGRRQGLGVLIEGMLSG